MPDLDEMDVGTLALSVPLRNAVIQVGAGGDYATGTIEVSKDVYTLSVRRTDGRPLQAQVVRNHRGDNRFTVRRDVFRRPVHFLDVIRIGMLRRHGLWFATGIVDLGRHRDLQSFVTVVARFGLAKQRAASGH